MGGKRFLITLVKLGFFWQFLSVQWWKTCQDSKHNSRMPILFQSCCGWSGSKHKLSGCLFPWCTGRVEQCQWRFEPSTLAKVGHFHEKSFCSCQPKPSEGKGCPLPTRCTWRLWTSFHPVQPVVWVQTMPAKWPKRGQPRVSHKMEQWN